MRIPQMLLASCRRSPERMQWLDRLPGTLGELEQRWSLTIGAPFENNVSCSWVATVTRANGDHAVLKLGMPHMEAEGEAAGLRFWNGDGAVKLLESDDVLNAMLLERCESGTALRELPEMEQDVVIAGLLRRLRRAAPGPHAFRPLTTLLKQLSEETLRDAEQWPDAGLVREGLTLFEKLPQSAPQPVVLATDLHADNVLRAQREPWLMIDPKPFVGDPAYDVVQHLINCEARLFADPTSLIDRVADLAGVDVERARLWTLARAAAEPRDNWSHQGWLNLARRLSRL